MTQETKSKLYLLFIFFVLPMLVYKVAPHVYTKAYAHYQQIKLKDYIQNGEGYAVIGAMQIPEKKVALSFDDGPYSPYTEQILDILDEYNIKATFCVLGYNVEKYPETTREIYARGHELCNHTYSHKRLSTQPHDILRDEIIRTYDALVEHVGIQKHISEVPFRAPFVEEFDLLFATLNEFELDYYGIDVATEDWLEDRTVEYMVGRVDQYVKPGSILLMHDGAIGDRSKAVEATRQIIEKLLNEGYQFITVQELVDQYKDDQGTVSQAQNY